MSAPRADQILLSSKVNPEIHSTQPTNLQRPGSYLQLARETETRAFLGAANE